MDFIYIYNDYMNGICCIICIWGISSISTRAQIYFSQMYMCAYVRVYTRVWWNTCWKRKLPKIKNVHKGKAVKVVHWEFASGALQKSLKLQTLL